jgi:hypothetical protein
MNTRRAGVPARKPFTIALGPGAARALSGLALSAMHFWFIAKLALPSEGGELELWVGLAALTGLVSSVAFFVCSYGVLANAPDAMLGEGQRFERNRAYSDAFKSIAAMLLLGSVGAEFVTGIFGVELSVAILQNYLLLMFTTALVLPATLLAWRDVALEDE